jgi:O-acetyl-ADP-ribose deacetylase (regulator of RNase III)
MTRVNVFSGDITLYEAGGLITAINSGGKWFGGIDGAIQRSAGNMFHSQAQAAMPLSDGQVVFARAMDGRRGRFGSVLFVVDDLKRPLSEILGKGLREADAQRLDTITVPTIRTGVMAGAYEPTVQAALDEMVVAVRDFIASGPTSVQQISFVVYGDADSERYLSDALQPA